MPKILPKMIFCTFTAVGFKEMINRPNAKKVLKIKPITASSFSLEMDLIKEWKVRLKFRQKMHQVRKATQKHRQLQHRARQNGKAHRQLETSL